MLHVKVLVLEKSGCGSAEQTLEQIFEVSMARKRHIEDHAEEAAVYVPFLVEVVWSPCLFARGL